MPASASSLSQAANADCAQSTVGGSAIRLGPTSSRAELPRPHRRPSSTAPGTGAARVRSEFLSTKGRETSDSVRQRDRAVRSAAWPLIHRNPLRWAFKDPCVSRRKRSGEQSPKYAPGRWKPLLVRDTAAPRAGRARPPTPLRHADLGLVFSKLLDFCWRLGLDDQRVESQLELLLERVVDEAVPCDCSLCVTDSCISSGSYDTVQQLRTERTLPSNISLTTSTEKCVSPFPPPCALIAAWPACAAESFETTSETGSSAAVICSSARARQFAGRSTGRAAAHLCSDGVFHWPAAGDGRRERSGGENVASLGERSGEPQHPATVRREGARTAIASQSPVSDRW